MYTNDLNFGFDMRTLTLSLILTIGNAASLFAQEPEKTPGLVELRINLMFWTLIIFGILYFILRKWAFPAILGAVEKREKALEDAIASAKRDREEAQKLLEDHRRQIDAARGEAQKLIADGREEILIAEAKIGRPTIGVEIMRQIAEPRQV